MPVASLLGEARLFPRLARVGLHVVGIAVDGVTGRDVAAGDHALAARGLALQGALDGDGRKEPGLGGWGREKGSARAEAAGGTADRIDGANAGGIAEKRLQDEPSGQTLFRASFGLEGTSRRDEVTGAQLPKGGKEETAPRPGGRASTLEQGRALLLDVVLGADAGTWRTGAVEDCDLLCGQESSGAGKRGQPFFWARP